MINGQTVQVEKKVFVLYLKLTNTASYNNHIISSQYQTSPQTILLWVLTYRKIKTKCQTHSEIRHFIFKN